MALTPEQFREVPIKPAPRKAAHHPSAARGSSGLDKPILGRFHPSPDRKNAATFSRLKNPYWAFAFDAA